MDVRRDLVASVLSDGLRYSRRWDWCAGHWAPSQPLMRPQHPCSHGPCVWTLARVARLECPAPSQQPLLLTPTPLLRTHPYPHTSRYRHTCPMMWSWPSRHPKEYFGAAHGVMGIMYTTLHHWTDVVADDPEFKAAALGTLHWLLSHAELRVADAPRLGCQCSPHAIPHTIPTPSLTPSLTPSPRYPHAIPTPSPRHLHAIFTPSPRHPVSRPALSGCFWPFRPLLILLVLCCLQWDVRVLLG
jgi:hypothetical protein